MIGFELSEEQKVLQQTVRSFVSKEIIPHAQQWDINGSIDHHVVERLGKLGILGLCIPKKYGGVGLDYISTGLACEELEYGETVFRVLMSVHLGLCSLGLLQWGSQHLKKLYLPQLASGAKLGAFGLTEPDAGSDVQAMRAKAERSGGSYVLSGTKSWISLSSVADLFLTFAYTDKSKGVRGISAFLVERKLDGLTTGDYQGKLGVRAGSTGELHFENVEIPKENLVGQEGEGFKIAMSCLDNGRFTVAAGSVGLAQAALDASLAYAKERKTFGLEIGKHQLIQQKIANMVAGVESARLLVLRAGWMKNQGLRNSRETALAKWVATRVAVDCADEAIQIHGANGYSNDYPVERFWRNARAATLYEGTNEIQTLIQGQYALGYRQDKPLDRTLPPFPFKEDV